MKGYVYLEEKLIEEVERLTDMDYGRKGDLVDLVKVAEMVEDLKQKCWDLQEKVDNLNQQLDYAVNGY